MANKSAGRKRSQTVANKKNTKAGADNGIRLEIVLCVVLAVAVILFISNFGLAGKAGAVISSVFKGIFGVMAYPFPVILFLGISFYAANKENHIIKRKMVGLILLFIFVCALFQLMLSGAAGKDSISSYYTAASNGNIAGGFIGGIIVFFFSKFFGAIGAFVLIFVGIIISLIILTQRPLVSTFQKKSGQAIKEAGVRHRQKRIEKRENTARLAAMKENGEVPFGELDTLSTSKVSAGRKNNTQKAGVVTDIDLRTLKGEKPENIIPANDLLTSIKPYNKGKEVPPEIEDLGIKAHEEEPTPNIQLNEIKEEAGNEVLGEVNKTLEESIAPGKRTKTGSKEKEEAEVLDLHTTEDPSEFKPEYIIPQPSLLIKMKVEAGDSKQHLLDTAKKLQETLRDFGVNVTVTNVSRGPAVTRYELQPEHGVKVSKILSLTDDIKLNLAAADIRIEAPIAGKAAVGIEVPNKENSIVPLRDMLESDAYRNFKSKLAFCVGRDLGGKPIISDIAKMPHLLIAGATGSGKSVCINTLIMSVLFKAKPDEVKMIMIDPKVIELSIYGGIPHLLLPVVTDPKKAAGALNWAVGEMTRRYKLFSNFTAVKNLKEYNAQVAKKLKDKNLTEEERAELKIEPQILIIVDELADLMMVAQNEVETAIVRLTQLARAAGIHLVVATQRPSVNVITGLIKANMPSRIAFAVTAGVDSRTILDMNGAERLLGKGDMLFYPQGYPKPVRVQGTFVPDEDVAHVVEFINNQYKDEDTVYDEEIEKQIDENALASFNNASSGEDDDRDQYFWDAGKFIIEKDKASIGMLQRVFKIGFNRAARIMDQLHEAGVVAGEEGTKPRRILMSLQEFEDLKNNENGGNA